MENDSAKHILALTARIASAYVRNNHLAAGDLPAFIPQLHAVIEALHEGKPIDQGEGAQQMHHRPAVPVSRSVTSDYIVSLEDGRKFRSLTRHLKAQYDMTPADYRARWNLPPDYPMVAPNYSRQRSKIAKRVRSEQLENLHRETSD